MFMRPDDASLHMASHIRRRELIVALGGAAAWALPAHTQQPAMPAQLTVKPYQPRIFNLGAAKLPIRTRQIRNPNPERASIFEHDIDVIGLAVFGTINPSCPLVCAFRPEPNKDLQTDNRPIALARIDVADVGLGLAGLRIIGPLIEAMVAQSPPPQLDTRTVAFSLVRQVPVGSAAKLATADMPNMAIESSAAHKTFESFSWSCGTSSRLEVTFVCSGVNIMVKST